MCSALIKRKQINQQRGSALIFTAVFIMIAGLLSAGFLALMQPVDRESQESVTLVNMENIMDAVAIYYQKHSRLPCPADPDRSSNPEPFGAEHGSGPNGDNPGSCSGSDVVGIVPFLTLGLSEDIARDGWRNFITFRSAVTPTDTSAIHEACRTFTPGASSDCTTSPEDWVCPPSAGGTGKNKNPAKALLCCGPIDDGFDVVDTSNYSFVYEGGAPPKPTGGFGYGGADSVAPPGSIHTSGPPTDPLAVVLISHGQNGGGAFLDDGSQMSVAGLTPEEQQNADHSSGIFIWKVRTEAYNGYFDDIIVWRTDDMLQTELGGEGYSALDCSTHE